MEPIRHDVSQTGERVFLNAHLVLFAAILGAYGRLARCDVAKLRFGLTFQSSANIDLLP